MMTETFVEQQSKQWFSERKLMQLTSSQFGDALGVGRGKPFDFFMSLLEQNDGDNEDTIYTRHGLIMEPIIKEAYGMLTGNETSPSGIWQPSPGSPLLGLCSSSPDAKVRDRITRTNGLLEVKAPYYKMYDKTHLSAHGIPRHYMIQIQSQLAISQHPWCDFMAVCTETREIRLLRVYAEKQYWKHISYNVNEFCKTLKEAKQLRTRGLRADHLQGVKRLKQCSIVNGFLPGERLVQVENILESDGKGSFKSFSGFWMDFDLLMANPTGVESSLDPWQFQAAVRQIDSSSMFKTST